MILEEINPAFFLAEFSFATNTFRVAKVGENEASDHIVLVGGISLHFEHKNRDKPTDDPKTEETWHKKKVRGVAVDQLHQTVKYFEEHNEIVIPSQAGDQIALRLEDIAQAERIVVYCPGAALSRTVLLRKFHYSSRLGKVHLFSEKEWANVVEYFLTPFEINEYLKFRRNLSERFGYSLDAVSEMALVGQYISERETESPSEIFQEELKKFQPPSEGSRFLQTLHGFKDRVAPGDEDGGGEKRRTILREFALLDRSNLENVSDRFQRSAKAALDNESVLPYRIVNRRRDCCFLFFPLTSEKYPERRRMLETYLRLAKYDTKCLRAVGMTFVLDPNQPQGLYIDWAYLEDPWKEHGEVSEILRRDYPFRPLKEAVVPRYKFKTPQAED